MTAAAFQYLLLALQALPSLVTAGNSVVTEVETLITQLKLFQSQNRDPTAAEWAALNANLLAALSALAKASQ